VHKNYRPSGTGFPIILTNYSPGPNIPCCLRHDGSSWYSKFCSATDVSSRRSLPLMFCNHNSVCISHFPMCAPVPAPPPPRLFSHPDSIERVQIMKPLIIEFSQILFYFNSLRTKYKNDKSAMFFIDPGPRCCPYRTMV
jgi:hypothetical protein